jgi:uncharacterized protein YwqG
MELLQFALHEILRASALRHLADVIEKKALPSIRLRAKRVDESLLKPGETKFGGTPDLPQGVSWPVSDGIPLPFIAQINLSTVAPYDMKQVLPQNGHLYFFLDVDAYFDKLSSGKTYQNTYYVFYHSDSLQYLHRSTFPAQLQRRYHSCEVLCTTEMTLPDYSRFDPTTFERCGFTAPLSEEEEEAYDIIKAQLSWTAALKYHLPLHRLLGHPDNVQWDMYSELGGTPEDWTLLLQIDSDDAPDMEWGDTGRIYFWIATKDLLRHDFTHIQFILQS